MLRLAALVVAAGFLFWFVTAVTVAGVFRDKAPAWVLGIAPYDARANAQLARQALTGRQDAAALAGAEALTVAALRRDPTVVEAVTALSLTYALRRQLARAERGFAYAETLSRRDIGTQLWLIERNVQRNDIGGALAHFDTALRTSPQMASTLYPVMASASAEPAIAAELNRLLLTRPAWGRDFPLSLMASQGDPRALYTVTRGLFRPSEDHEREQLGLLLRKLTALHAYDYAWRAYVAARPERRQSGGALWNGDFSREIGLPPFDWTFPENPAQVPERRPGPRGHVLALPAGLEETAEVARQLIRLAPGRYRVAARVGNVGGDAALRPQLAISCAGAAPRELARSDFPAAPETGAAMAVAFTVPAGCRYQWLSILVRGSYDRQVETTSWIGAVRIGEP